MRTVIVSSGRGFMPADALFYRNAAGDAMTDGVCLTLNGAGIREGDVRLPGLVLRNDGSPLERETDRIASYIVSAVSVPPEGDAVRELGDNLAVNAIRHARRFVFMYGGVAAQAAMAVPDAAWLRRVNPHAEFEIAQSARGSRSPDWRIDIRPLEHVLTEASSILVAKHLEAAFYRRSRASTALSATFEGRPLQFTEVQALMRMSLPSWSQTDVSDLLKHGPGNMEASPAVPPPGVNINRSARLSFFGVDLSNNTRAFERRVADLGLTELMLETYTVISERGRRFVKDLAPRFLDRDFVDTRLGWIMKGPEASAREIDAYMDRICAAQIEFETPNGGSAECAR